MCCVIENFGSTIENLTAGSELGTAYLTQARLLHPKFKKFYEKNFQQHRSSRLEIHGYAGVPDLKAGGTRGVLLAKLRTGKQCE